VLFLIVDYDIVLLTAAGGYGAGQGAYTADYSGGAGGYGAGGYGAYGQS